MMDTPSRQATRLRPPASPEDAPVRAVLGPTNTGKTHLALERMLAHTSGIMGFPLRLLARENYERMVRLKGVRAIGLITGEEKIIPSGARWFSCTVEAMPMDRPVDFIAVDEIQLCADPERGHVFTDRLLNARGQSETLFLGAETIAPLLRSLIRGIEIESRPRLSELTYTGFTRLSRLPPRSAIVAFSAGEVYAIAEAIRRRRGGCAVVMGQLSPRTRNAQVDLYQKREVDYLVATDAIGMGLNMDIHHVAFAGLSKFDGSQRRLLAPAEIAQIAGRAGRGTQDGTFGTTGDCPPLPESSVEAVENHQFEALHHLYWRNSALDYTSPRALYASLCQKPPYPGLRAAEPASDIIVLSALMRDTAIQSLTREPGRTRLLWEVCQIPDFRKLGEDSHIRQCAQIFTVMVKEGHLPSSWLEPRLANLERTEGDIDALMQRLMGIRIWAYVATRSDWVENPQLWRTRTRTIEDTLSDLLHERLAARFVDKRATSLARRLEEADSKPLLSAITRTGEVSVEGHAVGHMQGFAFIPDQDAARSDQPLLMRAARRAARSEIPRRVTHFLQTPDESLTLDPATGILLWEGDAIGHLQKGEDLLRPAVHVTTAEFLEPSHRERIRMRLTAFVAATLHSTLAPLYRAAQAVADKPALRGLIHGLMEQGGVMTLPGNSVLSKKDAHALHKLGLRMGKDILFCPQLLRPQPMTLRALLIQLYTGHAVPPLPKPGAVSRRLPPDTRLSAQDRALLLQTGWHCTEDFLIRLDIARETYKTLSELAVRSGGCPLQPGMASRLGVPAADLPEVLTSLGLRVQKASVLGKKHFGPATPTLLLPPRTPAPAGKRRQQSARTERKGTMPPVTGPFAALAVLQKRR
ncbi:helicase-related protein [Acetobacter persici]|uniref:helicase-related protein n=1 Tax=Acetobacter persici TaxID=1076596 RepID=UPI001F43E80C|nr:helicase-related protein [Acetobacter persici]MCG0997755.1 DNA helicase [Acetobacter persici]